jgi:Icc-related predicted phosphoesterase
VLRQAHSRYLAVALIAGAASLLTTALMPSAKRTFGPAVLAIKANPGLGRTSLLVPPLGTVSADTHAPPLDLSVTLSELNFPALGRNLSRSPRRELIGEIEAGLRSVALGIAVQHVIAAAVAGTVTAALVAGRRARYMLVGGASGAAVVAISLLAASASFDPDRFEEANYTGALQYAPQVMEAVTQSPKALANLNSRFATAAERLTKLLAIVAQPFPDPDEGTTALLHVSDIHSNPVGVEIARSLAEDFAVDAVIDTGDLTSFGQPIESRIGRLLNRFTVPYLFVPGNHDSPSNRAELGSFESVTLLDRRVATVDDVEILGWADPTFTASSETSTEEGNEQRESDAPAVASTVERLGPDVLAIHDERLAMDSVGTVPLVLTGHTHERGFDERDGTVILTLGSTGATGLGSFIVDSERPYEAEVIYFREGLPVALDYISLSGLGGDFEVERRTIQSSAEEGSVSPTIEN